MRRLTFAKSAQRPRGRCRRHAGVLRGGDRGQRVELVVHAGQVPVARWPAVRPRSITSKLRRGSPTRVKSLTAAPKLRCSLQQPACSTRGQAFLQAVDDDPAAGRHGAHQVVELAFDRGQVVEDVGVVEFQVVQDRRARRGSARTCCACRRTRCRIRRPR